MKIFTTLSRENNFAKQNCPNNHFMVIKFYLGNIGGKHRWEILLPSLRVCSASVKRDKVPRN